MRDVEPGEIVMFDEEGMHSIKTHCGGKTGLCVFEFVYFARPDSVIDGASVHRARRRAGAFLALEHPVQADVVVGVPDSGLDAALGYSQTDALKAVKQVELTEDMTVEQVLKQALKKLVFL